MNDKIEYLTPENTKIEKGEFETLNVFLKNGKSYKGVFAIACFPIKLPNKFISLFYQTSIGEVEEIGIIKDIFDFPEEERILIYKMLNKNYFSYVIKKIVDIQWKFGFLLFNVETDKGEKQFYLRWQRNSAIEYREKGKILIDIFEDRYIVPDVEKLTPFEKNLFTKYIYW